jgi:hypothetical protein
MTLRRQGDEDFERFRKERQRARPRPTAAAPTAGVPDEFGTDALRELQQVEQRELRDQRLTREVHDFFAEATQQAKSIVERVSQDAESATTQKVERDMEAFLLDAWTRMNEFVSTMMRDRRGQIAETQVEPSVGNIVGPRLDEFRFAGTAQLGDKHLGQDPFQTDVDEVQREFKHRVGSLRKDDGQQVVPIDRKTVAMIELEVDEETQPDEEEPATALAPEVVLPTTPPPVTRTTAVSQPVPASTARGDAADMQRFREALKQLVRQGAMTRDEALAAWQARVDARGGA